MSRRRLCSDRRLRRALRHGRPASRPQGVWTALALTLSSACCGLASCGGQYPGTTLAQQVESWATTSPDPTFSVAISELGRDLDGSARAEALGDPPLLRTECDVLVTDALSANQNLPTPDPTLTAILSKAYASAVDAGQDCYCAAGGRPCPRGATDKVALLDSWRKEARATRLGLVESEARVDTLTMQSRSR